MSRIQRPEDWEWTEDEHFAIWLAEILATPPGESRVRELCVAFRDPETWGRAVRALGPLRGRLSDRGDDMSTRYPRGLGGSQDQTWGFSQRPYDWEEDGEA